MQNQYAKTSVKIAAPAAAAAAVAPLVIKSMDGPCIWEARPRQLISVLAELPHHRPFRTNYFVILSAKSNKGVGGAACFGHWPRHHQRQRHRRMQFCGRQTSN